MAAVPLPVPPGASRGFGPGGTHWPVTALTKPATFFALSFSAAGVL
jgi:hypothetical protein